MDSRHVMMNEMFMKISSYVVLEYPYQVIHSFMYQEIKQIFISLFLFFLNRSSGTIIILQKFIFTDIF